LSALRRPAAALLALLALASAARAQTATPEPPPKSTAHLGSPVADALDKFDFGDYEGVVAQLRPLVEHGASELPTRADRIEALRAYGIACALTGRQTAAEGAFLLLLREEPATHLDAALVPPDAVAFFEQVRARYRQQLVAVYRRSQPRYYWFLNLLPPVGQFQNRERKKGFALGGIELALLGSSVISYALLASWEGHDHTFAGHADSAAPLRTVNIVSFSLLLGSVSYGIVDGLVVGRRRQRQEREEIARLGFAAPQR
jgi:hypothetical protein